MFIFGCTLESCILIIPPPVVELALLKNRTKKTSNEICRGLSLICFNYLLFGEQNFGSEIRGNGRDRFRV